MRTATAVLLLALATSLSADEPDIAKGLENLRNVHAAGTVLEFRRDSSMVPDLNGKLIDPWGTPYRIDMELRRIVGAGSDRVFDEKSWAERTQFDGLEGDVVFQDGLMTRSNRNWLYRRVTPGKAAAELQALRSAEIQLMIMHTPEGRRVAGLQASTAAMQKLAELADAHRAKNGSLEKFAPAAQRDAWGTPMQFIIDGNRYRIVSAGADLAFKPETWSQPPAVDAAEDMIYEGGIFTRGVDSQVLLAEKPPHVEPLSQPPDPMPPAHLDRSKWNVIGGEVKAPVATERAEPVYPDSYRRGRLAGMVIVQCAIDDKGNVESVRVTKSLAPDFDMSAADAVRRWKFQPATRAGMPVSVLFNLTINFKLN